jgi:aspartate/glutamate racemase
LPKHIGIVAASPEGSAFCYRKIGRRASEVEDPANRPMVTLHNRPFSTFVEMLNRGDWEGIAAALVESAHALHHAGADFCVLPDNALHHAVPLAERDSPIPWLSMIDLVADSVNQNGCRTLGLIGTKIVTLGSTYQTALGIRGMHLLVPRPEEIDAIDRIVFVRRGHLRDGPAGVQDPGAGRDLRAGGPRLRRADPGVLGGLAADDRRGEPAAGGGPGGTAGRGRGSVRAE